MIKAAWVAAYLEWLHVPAGRVHALLIGPGTFAPESGVSPLPGVANDITTLMATMLIDTFGVDPAEVDTCVDDAATVTEIRHRLAVIRGRAGPDDTVVVYFSGHSDNRATADEPFLIGYGGPDDIASMSPRDLAAALQMAVRDVVVVLDTHIARSFLDLLPMAPNLTVLMACGVDEVAYESYVDGVQHGLFTASLVSELTAGGRTTTYGALLDATQRRVQADPAHLGQTPQLFGVAQARVLTARFPLAGFSHAARRAVPRAVDAIVLGDAADALDNARAWWALGRRELHDDHPDRAVARLFNGRAPTTAGRIDLDLAIVAIDQGHRDEAITAIDAAIAHFDGEHRDQLSAGHRVVGSVRRAAADDRCDRPDDARATSSASVSIALPRRPRARVRSAGGRGPRARRRRDRDHDSEPSSGAVRRRLATNSNCSCTSERSTSRRDSHPGWPMVRFRRARFVRSSVMRRTS